MFLIKKKKRKKSSVASAASSVAFHGLITNERQITAGRGSNTEPEKAKPVEADHGGQRIEYRTRKSEAGSVVPSLASGCG